MKAAKKIEEVEAVCAKSVDQVSQDWVALIDDEKLEKFTEQQRTIEAEVNHMKSEMKKFPLV